MPRTLNGPKPNQEIINQTSSEVWTQKQVKGYVISQTVSPQKKPFGPKRSFLLGRCFSGGNLLALNFNHENQTSSCPKCSMDSVLELDVMSFWVTIFKPFCAPLGGSFFQVITLLLNQRNPQFGENPQSGEGKDPLKQK